MKISPPNKRSMIVAGIGLILSGLSFYVVSALLMLDSSEQKHHDFISNFTTKITSIQTSYKSFLQDGVSDVEKDILAPINSSKIYLQNIFYNKTKEDLGFDISTSEDAKVLLKLTIVELEKNAESIHTKAADFELTKAAFQKFANYISEHQQSHRVWVVMLAWMLALFLPCASILFFILDFQSSKQFRVSQSSAKATLQKESQQVQKLTGFIEAISSGNYSFDLNNSEEQDELNGTLTIMRDRLKKNAEEDQHRNWTSAGLAQAGEILRLSNAQELYDSIIKFVVKYTNSNQGGLFVLADDEQEKQLELVACYAYERKKFLARKVGIGQGLIGQCFLEKEKILLVEIPPDYVNITSGLGAANPSCLLIVPLKTNDVVYGVLELASFKEYKEYEIDWVERLTESIASTVASVKANENMKVLLEQTQQQAEEMKSQEEEMRQNMEELSATQEEMMRKEREYINRINELEGK